MIVVECPNCKKWNIAYKEDADTNCDKCGTPNELHEPDEVVNPLALITLVEDELENGNHHSIVGIPGTIYKEITEMMLAPEQEIRIARAIYNGFSRI